MEEKLHNTLSENNKGIIEKCKESAEMTYSNTKRRHQKKSSDLLNKARKKKVSNLRPEGLDRWVVNLSGEKLTNSQEEVLKLGLNFVSAPKKLPILDMVATVEEGARKLKTEEANDLRGRVCGVLRNAKQPKDNITKEYREALKELRKNENIVIVPADKGSSTVVLKREDYHSKLSKMLESGTYKQLKKDPTVTQETKIVSRLRALEKSGELPTTIYQDQQVACRLCCMYGLPRIHKVDVPLQPIVSCIKSPSYSLSKHIASIISPLMGQSDSFVKNSEHFISTIRDITVDPDDIMVSFDVCSLFTNVPIEEALKVISNMLVSDESLYIYYRGIGY